MSNLFLQSGPAGKKSHPDERGRDSDTAVIPCPTRHHRGGPEAIASTRARHRKTCHGILKRGMRTDVAFIAEVAEMQD